MPDPAPLRTRRIPPTGRGSWTVSPPMIILRRRAFRAIFLKKFGSGNGANRIKKYPIIRPVLEKNPLSRNKTVQFSGPRNCAKSFMICPMDPDPDPAGRLLRPKFIAVSRRGISGTFFTRKKGCFFKGRSGTGPYLGDSGRDTKTGPPGSGRSAGLSVRLRALPVFSARQEFLFARKTKSSGSSRPPLSAARIARLTASRNYPVWRAPCFRLPVPIHNLFMTLRETR